MYWLDGAVHATGCLPFDLADRGLLLGDGAFDTALVLGGRMVWRQAHLRRLAATCAALGFALDGRQADRAIDALVPDVARGILRLTVTRGRGLRGLVPPDPANPTLFAAVAPLTRAPFVPVSLQVSTIRRNETAPTARLKTLNYLDAILAARTAAAGGFDDALFLNTQGRVACTTVGNVFAVVGTRLVTPPLGEGVLAGTARATLLQLAPALGLQAFENPLMPEDLAAADAVFVTNSLKLLAPVTCIGSFPEPRGSSWTAGLVAALRDAVCRDCGVDPGGDAEEGPSGRR